MNQSFKKFLPGLACLAVTGLATVAQAQVQVINNPVTAATVDTGAINTINKFNTPGSTLTSVLIQLATSGTASGSLHNNANGDISYTDVQFGSLAKISTDTSNTPPAPVLLSANTFFDYGGGSIPANGTTFFSTQSISGSNSILLTAGNGAAFTQFIGAGTIPIRFYATADTLYIGPSNVEFHPNTAIGSTVTVTYTSEVNANATPEPGSVAMLFGMGVTGAAFIYRRRSQK
jgi:hypothetical protein